MIPMPPCCAMAMAILASVTVSMAAETMGRFETDPASRDGGRDIHVVGVNLGPRRHQQHIIKGQTDRN